ncbi:VCBS repeat-containing protein [Archangium gephyra]|uniref:FG-GAP repeat domain-containing protein n=1 Tax=Archangium gephyra TaxID=48 RepID=UPI0035D4E33B
MGSSGFSKNKNTRAGARFSLQAVLALGLAACGGTVVEEEAVEAGHELSSLGHGRPRVPYRAPRGGGRPLGDYNGDGRDDFLCHDATNGFKWIDYANTYGQFHGTDWERDAGWCAHDTGRLYKGDFNGDGRDDWLCHDFATGYKWIDYADVNGQFYGEDWQRDAGWCWHDTGEFHIGDFNGERSSFTETPPPLWVESLSPRRKESRHPPARTGGRSTPPPSTCAREDSGPGAHLSINKAARWQ